MNVHAIFNAYQSLNSSCPPSFGRSVSFLLNPNHHSRLSLVVNTFSQFCCGAFLPASLSPTLILRLFHKLPHRPSTVIITKLSIVVQILDPLFDQLFDRL